VTGVGVFVSTLIYALLYFGLHKALLKIKRIEEALGIASYEPAVQPNETSTPVPTDANINKKSENPDDLPWELREGD
jgi:hypothetical protein